MFRTSSGFDKLLDKATSNLLLEVDLFSTVQLCDLIRQKDCPPKYAIQAIKRKLSTPNPHTVYYTLQVLESVVKNCGMPIHEEVATKEFMEFMRELAKSCPHENVREKVLELIQTWAHAFRKLPTYRAVQDVLNIMKAEGLKFPPLLESDAMFTADTAPEWQDGGCCNRCRVEFGIMNRKHHCRACGQIFCGKCSSKTTPLPKFGIEKEVRVCDACFEKYGKESGLSAADTASLDDAVDMLVRANRGQPIHPKSASSTAPASGNPAASTPKAKTAEELEQEENEQLELALAISQSEAEAKEREKMERKFNSMRLSGTTGATGVISPEASINGGILKKQENAGIVTSPAPAPADEDPDLSRYLNRSYWEERHSATKVEDSGIPTGGKAVATFQPSAPIINSGNRNKSEQAEELDQFVAILREQIDMFTNRMNSNSSRGRHISNDTSVQSLFMNLTAMHSQLLNYIHAQDDARSYYEGLQDKVSQARDAREALDSLRKEHEDERRRAAEEAERQRQIQMAIKLNDMRQKKHQYLQYQQNLALQRVQEEQRIMQLRMEQQRMVVSGSGPGPGQGPQSGAYAYAGTVPPGYGMAMGMGMVPAGPYPQQQQMPGPGGMMPQQQQHHMQMPQQSQGQYQGPEQQQHQQHFVYPGSGNGAPQGQDPNAGLPQQQQQYYVPQHQQQQQGPGPGPMNHPQPVPVTSDPNLQGQGQQQQAIMSPPTQSQVEIANLIDF